MKPEENMQDKKCLPIDEQQFALDKLFAYLRDVLYSPKDASLNPEELAEPFRDLAQGMLFIGECVGESRALANELSRGNLDASQKISPDNDLASGLKNLQSTLKHISWQVSQVARGDYNQHLSFAGAFSDSINDMIAQLKEREDAMHAEIQLTQQLAEDSRNTVVLLEGITKSIAELIIVVDRYSLEWLYTNHQPTKYLPNKESVAELKAILDIRIEEYNKEPISGKAQAESPMQHLVELMGEDGSLCQYFSVVGYPITWMERKSFVLILVDVTAEHREREELEQVAYYDTLTSTYSRHYGMIVLERWLEERQTFVVVFADIDGLKYVNDTLGHAAGDEYILAVSQMLSSFGEQVVVCRLGGDEFMMLIRHTSVEQAHARLEEMRASLAEDFEGGYDRSFSFGLVGIDQDNTKSASLLLSIADESMYEDKRSRKKKRRAQS